MPSNHTVKKQRTETHVAGVERPFSGGKEKKEQDFPLSPVMDTPESKRTSVLLFVALALSAMHLSVICVLIGTGVTTKSLLPRQKMKSILS